MFAFLNESTSIGVYRRLLIFFVKDLGEKGEWKRRNGNHRVSTG